MRANTQVRPYTVDPAMLPEGQDCYPRSASCLSGSRAGFVCFPQVDDLRLWKSGFSSRMMTSHKKYCVTSFNNA
jgi:hypothetical protein